MSTYQLNDRCGHNTYLMKYISLWTEITWPQEMVLGFKVCMVGHVCQPCAWEGKPGGWFLEKVGEGNVVEGEWKYENVFLTSHIAHMCLGLRRTCNVFYHTPSCFHSALHLIEPGHGWQPESLRDPSVSFSPSLKLYDHRSRQSHLTVHVAAEDSNSGFSCLCSGHACLLNRLPSPNLNIATPLSIYICVCYYWLFEEIKTFRGTLPTSATGSFQSGPEPWADLGPDLCS